MAFNIEAAYGTDEIKLTPEQLHTPVLEFSKVGEKALNASIDILGVIAYDTDKVIQLRPERSGKLEKFLVSIGDSVDVGQTIAGYTVENDTSSMKELKSTYKGMVMGIYAEPGDSLDPSIPAMSIADTSSMRCILDVYEKDIKYVKKGEDVEVSVSAFPGKIFRGKVTYVSSRVDENSRTIKVRADIANPGDELKYGMFVSATVKDNSHRALMIPENSLQQLTGDTVVFILKNDKTAAPRRVTTGQHRGGFVEILSGLKKGETIISKGGFVLKSELENNN